MKPKPWPLSNLTLKVLDLQKQVSFYQAFGMRLIEQSDRHAILAAADEVRLTLKLLPEGRPRPPKTAGLFHFALLLPDRESLGAFVRFTATQGFHFEGAANHLVSESLYFADEEGNGIEVYADRPRPNWEWKGHSVQMATLALDLEELAALPGPGWRGFPAGTRLGHIHLTVGDLDRAQTFYESLGLRRTLDWGNFRFFAWNGYHHHLAINLVEGRRVKQVTPEISGIESFSIHGHPERESDLDPDGVAVLLR
jgi:catechol 2,3-dioxygenase